MYNLHSREGQGEIIEGQNKNIIYRFALTMKLDSKFLHNLSHENTMLLKSEPDQVKGRENMLLTINDYIG